MTEAEIKQDLKEPSQPSSNEMTNSEPSKLEKETDVAAFKDEQPASDTVEIKEIEQDKFSDALDKPENNNSNINDLSSVISKLQVSVDALPDAPVPSISSEKEGEEDTDPKPYDAGLAVLDTIPEVETEINELGSSLIKDGDNQKTGDELATVEDIPLDEPSSDKKDESSSVENPDAVKTEKGDKEDDSEGIRAGSEPGSPIPEKKTPTDIQIASHFEKIRSSIDVPPGENMADFITPPTPGLQPESTLADKNDEELDDLEPAKSKTSSITLNNINFENVKANTLSPRQQELFDKDMLKGMNYFFNNKFSEAKAVFENKSKEDPLYALGLGCMAFIKAITSYDPKDIEAALLSLGETYHFAAAQIEAASAKKPLVDTVSHYFTNLMGTNPTHLPTNTRPLNRLEMREQAGFMPNGALRAHVIKAECGLLMAIIFLSQETVVGYLKAGLNLRRAYNSYSLVWQEYKRMGQNFNVHMDKDTISAIQFGIGSVHLLLSSLPPKILKIVSAFGWSADKHLGFALLKLCLEGKRIRSPLASLMLLSYYVLLTSYAPQVLTRELIQPAIECLLDAQQTYPNSAFFLFFAGRVSRLARNLPLSTQSFVYTYEVSQGDWAETTMGHLATFEIAFNSAMALDWASAAVRSLELQSKYNSPAFLKYFYGACMEMLGNRTEAILAFAEAPKLIDKKKKSQSEQFIMSRVSFFEVSGFQDLNFSLPAVEILLAWNAFPCMSPEALEKCLDLVESTLERIYEREKLEYDIRTVELVPSTATPDYYDQRGILLLAKASIYNALGRFSEGIVHLNWLIDNKEKFKHTNWLAPFAYWECGNTCWGMEEYKRARHLWETTLTYSGYDLEYRLATRLNLAIMHAIELGVPETVVPKNDKGKTTHGRKRMSIVASKSTGSIVSSS